MGGFMFFPLEKWYFSLVISGKKRERGLVPWMREMLLLILTVMVYLGIVWYTQYDRLYMTKIIVQDYSCGEILVLLNDRPTLTIEPS